MQPRTKLQVCQKCRTKFDPSTSSKICPHDPGPTKPVFCVREPVEPEAFDEKDNRYKWPEDRR